MKKLTINTSAGKFDLELMEHHGKDLVATISRTNGNKYLQLYQVPRKVRKIIKKNYKIALLDVKLLNYMLGLC